MNADVRQYPNVACLPCTLDEPLPRERNGYTAPPRAMIGSRHGASTSNEQSTLAQRLARGICEGFIAHDERDRDGTRAAFSLVDTHQFAHLSEETAARAAAAYVDALWAKDAVEVPHVDGRSVEDPGGLADDDWNRVEDHLHRRARIVGMSEAYAERTTEAWRRHKVGGDYWTPTLAAQTYEIRAALDGTTYPDKDRFGQSGYGHLAARYLVGVELHDMHTDRHWRQAVAVMTTYFEDLLRLQGERT